MNPIPIPVSRFEFERIDLAIASLLANQPVASDSERARDQCQRCQPVSKCSRDSHSLQEKEQSRGFSLEIHNVVGPTYILYVDTIPGHAYAGCNEWTFEIYSDAETSLCACERFA